MNKASATGQDAEWDTVTDELPPGTQLLSGQYTIERFLAAGGFGMTYRALDSLDRPVVIKECFPSAFCKRTHVLVQARSRAHQDEFEGIVRLFVQEAKSLAKLRHPNIVGVHQVFVENETAYMALDFVDGRDLLDILEETPNALPPERIQAILRDILGAIGFVHGEGMLHRDISPDNILLKSDGTPVLIDFGAARQQATKQSRVLSALRVVKDGYSPQEFYVTGAEQGPFSDLYALGASFYHLISGEAPPDSQTRLAARATQQEDPLRPLAGRFKDYPPRVLESIDAALSVLPQERPQTAEDWVRAIDGDGAALPALGRVRSRIKTRAVSHPATAIPQPRQRGKSGKKRMMGGVAASALAVAAAAAAAVALNPGVLSFLPVDAPAFLAEATAPDATAVAAAPAAPDKATAKVGATDKSDAAPIELAAEPVRAAERPGARAFERRVAAAAASYRPALRPEAEGDPRAAEVVEVAAAVNARMAIADVRRREIQVARSAWRRDAAADAADPRPAEAAAIATEVALLDHKLRRLGLLHTVRPVPRPAAKVVPPETPSPAPAPAPEAEAPIFTSNLEVRQAPPSRLTTRQALPVALAPSEPAAADWGFADTISPIVAPIFAAPAPPPEMAKLVTGWSVALPFGDLRADAGGNVMIRSLDGVVVDDLAAFERVLAERYQPGEGESLQMKVGIGGPGQPAAIEQALSLPLVREVGLENGPRFRTERRADLWETRVVAAGDPAASDLKVGDVLLGEVSTGARVDGEDTLRTLLRRALDAGTENLSFAVRRDGADWVASMTLSRDE